MTERWRQIEQTHYEVSDLGRVRNGGPRRCRATKGLLTGSPNGKGYWRVTLRVNKQAQWRYVHRLVLAAFVGPCPVGQETNHKFGDKSDNRLRSLEYVTSSQNNQHAHDTGLQPRIRARKLICPRHGGPRSQAAGHHGDGSVRYRCARCHAEAQTRYRIQEG